jgi:UDP-N-acetyl-2-amino-2-deoxyglucuronate dehydrogenase
MQQTSFSKAQPVRLLIIGLGKVAEIHLAAYADCADVVIVGGVDPAADRRSLLGERHGFPAFATLYEALPQIAADAACVLSPTRWHEEHVIACLTAGLHVLCEKPLALSLDSADRMIAAAQQAGRQLGYGASYRYLPALATARDIIRSGAIGEVLLMQEQVVGGGGLEAATPLGPAHFPEGGPGGVGMGLVDHGIHLIDTFAWLIDSPIMSATGRGAISGQPSRTEHLIMRFASGATGILVYEPRTFATALPNEGLFAGGGGWSAAGKVVPDRWACDPGWITVNGTHGALRIAHYANAVYLFDGEGVRSVPVTGNPMPGNFTAQIGAFAAAVREGQPFAVPAERGRAALAALLAAYHEKD